MQAKSLGSMFCSSLKLLCAKLPNCVRWTHSPNLWKEKQWFYRCSCLTTLSLSAWRQCVLNWDVWEKISCVSSCDLHSQHCDLHCGVWIELGWKSKMTKRQADRQSSHGNTFKHQQTDKTQTTDLVSKYRKETGLECYNSNTKYRDFWEDWLTAVHAV